ncbi:CLUMA_CG012209, isoform A, partial [Clunio marinus]
MNEKELLLIMMEIKRAVQSDTMRTHRGKKEAYPRVLECILQTESPELMLTHKDEILDTLDTIAIDSGKSFYSHIIYYS